MLGDHATNKDADVLPHLLPQVYSWGIRTHISIPTTGDTTTAATNTNIDSVAGLEHSLYDTTELGDPNDLEPIGPSSRIGRTHVVMAATSDTHTAVVTQSGNLLLCGDNRKAAVDPTKRDKEFIHKPTLLECVTVPVVQVSCGLSHTAAVTATGTVLTWGNNDVGQLGHRASTTKINNTSCMPQTMCLGRQHRAASVACGHGFTLVLTTRMQVLIMGRITDTTPNHTVPTMLPELFGLPVTKLAAGHHHAVVVTCHGTAFAWGDNRKGQCGQEHPKELHVPVPMKLVLGRELMKATPSSMPMHNKMSPLPPAETAVNGAACGEFHTVLITKTGKLLVCGSNENGQLGLDTDPTTETDLVTSLRPVVHPEAAEEDARFVAAVAGRKHTLVLDSNKNVWQFASTKDSDNANIRCILTSERSIVGLAAGGNHCIAISSLPVEDVPPALPNPAPPSLSISASFPKKVSQLLSDKAATTAGDEKGGSLVQHKSVEDLVLAVDRETTSSQISSSASSSGSSVSSSKQSTPILSESAVRELATRAEELCKSPGVLNGLFLDPMELDMLYQKVLHATPDKASRQLIASAVERGMFQGLQSLTAINDGGGDTACTAAARLKFPESVRFLLLYLQCPLFSDGSDENDKESIVFDRRGDLTLLLCEAFLGLSYEGYKAMVMWVTALYPREVFVRCLVKPLLRQLERGLDPNAGPVQRVVPLIVAVLQWLYVTSERAGGIAHPEDFWSNAIGARDPQLAFRDLIRWKKSDRRQRSCNFFLCSHAFLFSPATKRNLLAIENEMEMIATATSDGVTYNAAEQTFEIKPFWVLEVDRENLLEQTLQKVKAAKATDLRRKLKVVFQNEEGIDAGGVTREFFQLLSAQLFDVNSGMWSSRFDEEEITWFNSDCFWNDEGFYLVGILVGLAVYNSVLLDVHFPPAVYRKLLGLPLGLEDMVDSRLGKSLQQLLDYAGNDVEDVFCLSFSLEWMDLGTERTVELKPGGADIPVTSENKEEYVRLYVKWLLEESINPQYDAFERGFMKVMENSTLDFMSPHELELLVVGSPELDFDALEENATYEGFNAEAHVIQHFWSFLKGASKETRLQFLRFSTRSSKAPIGGLGKLPFKIQKNGENKQQLPTSHTCFNTLLLPDYGDDYDLLAERLGRAVLECEGFGLQ